MKKITVILICLLFSASAFATESRVYGLGYIFEYMDDDSNILIFPGTLSHYNNSIILDSDLIDDSGSLTLVLKDKKRDLTYGFMFQKDYRDRSFYGDISRRNSEVNQFIIARKNSAFFIGTRGTSEDEEYSSGTDIDNDLDNYFYLTTGYGYSSKGDNAFDLGLSVVFFKDKNRRNYENAYRKEVFRGTGYESTLYLRKKQKLAKGFLRSFMELSYYGYTSEYEREYTPSMFKNETYDATYFFNMGFGYEKQVNSKTTLWAGFIPIGYIYESDEDNIFSDVYYDSTLNEHYSVDRLNRGGYSELFLSVESKLNKWITARIAAKNTYNLGYSNRSDCREVYGSTQNLDTISNSFRMYYGLGAHYKNFNLDFVVDTDVAYTGPYFLTGADNDYLFYYMSASYRW